ncbi:6-phosphogluconolactonase [Deinococcus radiopugnans]
MDVILAARQTLLLVGGAHKREVLHAALERPETPEVPASFLRRTALTVIADEAAWA